MSLEEIVLSEEAKIEILNMANPWIQQYLYEDIPFVYIEGICDAVHLDNSEKKGVIDYTLDRYNVYKVKQDQYQAMVMSMQDGVLEAYEIATVKQYWKDYFDGNIRSDDIKTI